MLRSRQIKLIALILLVLLSPFSATFAKVIVSNQRRYYSVYDLCSRYGMRVYAQSGGVVLHNNTNRLELTLNRRVVTINRTKHTLSFPVIYQEGTFVSEHDMIKILDPILNPKSLTQHGNRVIVIDPGHGGKDSGAIGSRYNEKSITIALAKTVAGMLQKMGYTVHLTRTTDTYVGLNTRADLANRYKADLFVSIHVNAAANKSVSGIECYALTPVGAPSSNSNNAEWTRSKGSTMEANSAALAHYIQRQLIQYTKANDRGVKHARFAVLKENIAPSVLIETGFISNSSEEQKLGSKEYLTNLARGIVNGIILYQRSMLKGKP